MKIVHMVGNAHIDPVWLWRRGAGVDTTVATIRSACDRLDEYPEFVFTASGSWFHRQAELLDPTLFERVRRFVQAGRWALVGGMVIQPDCNLPGAESFCRQLEVGQAYYRTRFGQPTRVGYNVDSFGHGAFLPRFLRQAGIDSYVFMRPGGREKQLPGPLFRWRSPDGQEVIAYRLPGGYGSGAADLRKHVERVLANTPPDHGHMMCFYGVGDHGGGPTKAQIEWIRDHAEDFPGARLAFSHPRAFFDAMAPMSQTLPVVAEELQHHAVGCYSVERRIKVSMRRAEARLVQAEQIATMLAVRPPTESGGRSGAAPAGEQVNVLEDAWQAVLFNQFHDVAGGTCLDAANCQAAAELAAAEAAADDRIIHLTRRAFRGHAQPGVHKLVVLNPADQPFDGYIEHEPWFGGEVTAGAVLRDEQGRTVPSQSVEPLAKRHWYDRLLFPLSVPAGGTRVLRVEKPPIRPDPRLLPDPSNSRVRADPTGLAGPVLAVQTAGQAINVAGWSVAFDVHDDPTDTWSHSVINKFPDASLGRFTWVGQWEVVEKGPLRAAIRRQAVFDNSRLWCRLSLADGEPMLRVRVSVTWAQVRQLLRMRLAPAPPVLLTKRTDWVSGGSIERALDGLEYPLAGATWVQAAPQATSSPSPSQGEGRGEGTALPSRLSSLAIVAPEVFSLKVEPAAVDLLLIRSPFTAHHDPTPASIRLDHPVSDQGNHEFDLLLWPGFDGGIRATSPVAAAPADALATLAAQMLVPPVIFDLTG